MREAGRPGIYEKPKDVLAYMELARVIQRVPEVSEESPGQEDSTCLGGRQSRSILWHTNNRETGLDSLEWRLGGCVSPWEKLLERPHSGGHFVQLYEADEGSLARNVGLYLWEGLVRGDGALMIVTPEHQELFSRHLESLGANLPALAESRQLVFRDAQRTLAEFMVDGQPEWPRFERAIRAAMRRVVPGERAEGLRAYGEMVGILWKMRQFGAAIRVEQFWNKLLEHSTFSLYCAYAIDVFGTSFDVANLDGVLCAHTHLVPAEPNGTLEIALHCAMDEILGTKGAALRVLIKANDRPRWAVMPTAENIVLWLRKNLPEQADEIVKRARYYYQLQPQQRFQLQQRLLPQAAGSSGAGL